jgi:hypothetical protein
VRLVPEAEDVAELVRREGGGGGPRGSSTLPGRVPYPRLAFPSSPLVP